MKKLLLVSTSVFAIAASAQNAAAQDWSGMYFGLGLGGAVQTSSTNLDDVWVDEGYSRPWDDLQSSNGMAAGVYGGMNWQQPSGAVFGVEADASYIGSVPQDMFNHVDSYYDGVLRNGVDFMATVRGRAGMAKGPLMGYVTGGVAIGHVKSSYTVGEKDIHFNREETKLGFVVGGGAEYMINPNTLVRTELLYARFGGADVSDLGGYFTPDIQAHFKPVNVMIGRVGLAFKW